MLVYRESISCKCWQGGVMSKSMTHWFNDWQKSNYRFTEPDNSLLGKRKRGVREKERKISDRGHSDKREGGKKNTLRWREGRWKWIEFWHHTKVFIHSLFTGSEPPHLSISGPIVLWCHLLNTAHLELLPGQRGRFHLQTKREVWKWWFSSSPEHELSYIR